VHGFRIYSISFLFAGFNIFASSFFTSMNNRLISAIISVVHTLIYESGSVLILPIIFGMNGIWFSIIVAELLAMIVSTTLIWRLRYKYKIIM
ncbi:MAG: MATE family efflux transporter, partial [Selenomonadaceae bacterium]|nr:MATE family efflux transporter [Selenomonadaceae bacterium]